MINSVNCANELEVYSTNRMLFVFGNIHVRVKDYVRFSCFVTNLVGLPTLLRVTSQWLSNPEGSGWINNVNALYTENNLNKI